LIKSRISSKDYKSLKRLPEKPMKPLGRRHEKYWKKIIRVLCRSSHEKLSMSTTECF